MPTARAQPDWHSLSPALNYANFYRAEPGAGFGPRCIFDFQAIFVAAGEGVAEIGGATYALAGGDLIFYGPRVPHRVTAAAHSALDLVGLHFSFPPDRGAQAPRLAWPAAPAPPPHLHCGLSGPVAGLSRDLALSYAADPGGRGLEKRGLLLRFFQAWLDAIERGGGRVARRHLRLLERAEQALAADLRAPPAWREIARELQLSPRYLSRLFRRHTGFTVRGYVREQRLLEARRLLAHSALNVSEVAWRAGFADPLYFSREFTHRFQITPSAFRQGAPGI